MALSTNRKNRVLRAPGGLNVAASRYQGSDFALQTTILYDF
jgi:hypothetical protein